MTPATSMTPPTGFRHEALLYEGVDQFLSRTVPFIQQGVIAGEAVLVVVNERKIDLLKDRLGDKSDAVSFADMKTVGSNPARIIPAWRNFVDVSSQRRQAMRGIGEPIWPDRTAPELAECHHHEALLNAAFGDTPRFWLMCPYDTGALQPEVIEDLARTHPLVNHGTGAVESPAYDEARATSEHFTDPLPPPAAPLSEFAYSRDSLRDLRAWISDHSARAGLDEERTGELVLAAHEIATNSVLHGGGSGLARFWTEYRTIICEFADAGHMQRALVGREFPRKDQPHGRGLWMVNQLCDLVQIRSNPGRTVVRLHKTIVASDRAVTHAIAAG
jgi:anti-sigma regulatory factor (Ser/Thr protein kinase)